MKIFVTYFYRKYDIERPDKIMPGLSVYCKGLKHKDRKLVQDIGIKFYEGNKKIPLRCINLLKINYLILKRSNTYLCTSIFVLDW